MTQRVYNADNFAEFEAWQHLCLECHQRTGCPRLYGSCRVCTALFVNEIEDVKLATDWVSELLKHQRDKEK